MKNLLLVLPLGPGLCVLSPFPAPLLLLNMHSTRCPACMEKTSQTHTDFALLVQSKDQARQQDATVQKTLHSQTKQLETWSSCRNNFFRVLQVQCCISPSRMRRLISELQYLECGETGNKWVGDRMGRVRGDVVCVLQGFIAGETGSPAGVRGRKEGAAL